MTIKVGVSRVMGIATEEKAEDTFSVGENVDSTAVNRKENFPEEKGEEVNEKEENIQDRNEFMELYEENLKSIREGNVVKGEIIQIDKEFVLVDIGYKSEGQIRTAEFINSRGELTAKVGDAVETGQPLVRLAWADPGRLDQALPLVRRALEIGEERVAPPALIHGEVS